MCLTLHQENLNYPLVLYRLTTILLCLDPHLHSRQSSMSHSHSSSCDELNTCRTVWNIVWSCITTIFACTWVAIHPNIPSPNEWWVEIAVRRAGIMVMVLIAPELAIMWAIRQWVKARHLAKRYKSAFSFTVSTNT